jgi:type 1 glutamine amidotransferase
MRHAGGWRVDELSRKTPISSPDLAPAQDRAKIDAAVPRQAIVKPKQPRKLLVMDLCVNGAFYHRSIPHANLALELMGKYTRAFTPVFSNDVDNLKYPKIKEFDAIFLNSVIGEVFLNPDVMNGLLRYVREGGGVAGLHAATWASQNVPEYGELMGARSGPHKYNGEPGTVKIDDPESPLTKDLGGKGFEFFDEYYHFPADAPYSREKLHVLLSIDVEKTDISPYAQVRPDKDFGLVWIRSFGKGRVFHCAMAHRPEFLETPDLSKLILAGIQFALGDLEADTTPSAKLGATR